MAGDQLLLLLVCYSGPAVGEGLSFSASLDLNVPRARGERDIAAAAAAKKKKKKKKQNLKKWLTMKESWKQQKKTGQMLQPLKRKT